MLFCLKLSNHAMQSKSKINLSSFQLYASHIYFSNGKITKTEIGIRSGVATMSVPNYAVNKPLQMVCRRNSESFGDASRKTLEYCKLSFIGEYDFSSEDNNADSNADSKGQPWKFSAGNKNSIGLDSKPYVLYSDEKCLYFNHVLKIFKRLRLMVVD